MKRLISFAISAIGIALIAGCACNCTCPCADGETDAGAGAGAGNGWQSLFDGKTLKNWEVAEFGGQGDVKVENGEIIVDMGETLSGITWAGPKLPRVNYELTLEAKKIDGDDFFCGIGFPVGKTYASFVAGGWGGGVIGISSIDGLNASENETASVMEFPDGKWFRFRLRVTKQKIDVWINDKQVIDFEYTGRQITIHPAMDLATPLGLATYITRSAFRNIKIRELPPSPSK